jgi:Na+(H+)/acetate symporter ActP
MNPSALILLLIALVAANLPFFSERLFFIIKFKNASKSFFWRLVEWLALYFLVGLAAYLLESKLGGVQTQRWEFYAVTVCLFLVFAYPGFVYRYLWRANQK